MNLRIVEREVVYYPYGKGERKATVYCLQAYLGIFFKKWREVRYSHRHIYRKVDNNRYFCMLRDAEEEMENIKKALHRRNAPQHKVSEVVKIVKES